MPSKREWDWPSDSMPTGTQAEKIDALVQWMKDLCDWGKNVRDDILRLEGQAGFASGDPGDPPEGPFD